MINEEARIPVYLNDEQARQALKNLTAEAEKWRQKMREAAIGNDIKGMKDAERELKKVTNEANRLKKEAFDVNKVLNNLGGASINDLKKTISALRKEQAGLTRDSKEYAAITQKIAAVKGEFSKINGVVKEQGSYLSNIVLNAKQLLPAFGFGAIAIAAQQAFKNIIASTDTLSTQWEIFMGGMTSATNEFFRTIATGDWSNFLDNMKEAVRVGREYREMLDKIDEQQRAMDIYEADAIKEKAELEIKLRSGNLSRAEREAAGARRIQIEEQLAARRAELAQKSFDTELSVAAQQSKLSGEQIMMLSRDFDSEMKLRAEAYNERYTSLKKSMFTEKEISAILGKDFTSNEALYAQALRNMGNTTDEQLNKVVAAYVKLKEAQDSALTNTKRIRVQVANLLAGKDENAGGRGNLSAATPETSTKKWDDMLKPEADSPISNYPEMVAQKEAEALAAKKASEEEWTAFLNKQIEERMNNDEKGFEFEKELAEARKQLKIEYAAAIGEVAGMLAAMFKEGSAAQIAALAIEKAATIAQIIFNTAVANSKAVAMSPVTFGQPWVGINTASAAASIAGIVGTTIASFKDKRNNDKPGFYSGGFTGYGADNQVAGIVHKNEFVVNAASMRNPAIRQQVNMIDAAQRTGRNAETSAISSAGNIANEQAKALTLAINNLLQWQPTIYTELIKKDLDTLSSINQKRGL